jgi:hypothetical protein
MNYQTRQYGMKWCVEKLDDVFRVADKYCNLEWSGSCETEQCKFSNYDKCECKLKTIKEMMK